MFPQPAYQISQTMTFVSRHCVNAVAATIRCRRAFLVSKLIEAKFPATPTIIIRHNSKSTTKPSMMELSGYKRHSKNQYAAHKGFFDILEESMERLAKRINLEDRYCDNPRRRHIVDLGSADGSNSMRTLRYAVNALRRGYSSSSSMNLPLRVTFEEHPNIDEAKMKQVLRTHDDWFHQNNIIPSILIKSFYEPLFAPESVDFAMSYICVHWLDTNCDSVAAMNKNAAENIMISDWKTMHDRSGNSQHCTDFTSINETSAPKSLHKLWKRNFADIHLARFLALRARELRPGAEALIVMVGHPHQYVCPSDGGPSPLTRGMKRCIERGEIRENVLRRTIVPYFLRTINDVKDAFKLATTMEIDFPTDFTGSYKGKNTTNTPGALLELVNVRSISVVTGGCANTNGDANPIEGAFDLFWSIHASSIRNAGATTDEMDCIRKETRLIFNEIYDAEYVGGVPSTFLALLVRRRTRSQWKA